jgi:hypothetical protein
MYMHFHHFEVLDLQLAFLGKAVARLKENTYEQAARGI